MRDIRHAPRARKTVSTTGNSSGRFAIAIVIPASKPFSQRRSASAFLSYHDVIADASRNGFNIVTDRWRIITPSDGIPSYDEKPPVSRPSMPVPPPVVREAKPRGRRTTVAVELAT